MTKIITRYFPDVAAARKTQRELIYQNKFSSRILSLYDSADGLEDALKAQSVEAGTAKTLADKMASGGAVMVVKAGFKPLGVAQTFREVTAKMGAADLGDALTETEIKDPLNKLSIMSDHPLMVSRPLADAMKSDHMANWPIPLISRRKPFKESLIPPHARMADWPFPLLDDRKPYTESIIGRHQRMADFPIPLLSDRKPYNEMAIPRHGRMADIILPLISRRKPRTPSIFPRHQRMATVPFPLLINGKTGQNALVPGHKRMANFPIPLLSDRKPSTASAIPRHARMANFPIPLLSDRKPNTASAIPRHARMADMILPLISKGRDGKGWSLSRALGLPTLIKR